MSNGVVNQQQIKRVNIPTNSYTLKTFNKQAYCYVCRLSTFC